MKIFKRTKMLSLLLVFSLLLSTLQPLTAQARNLSTTSFAAYSWILLENSYPDGKIQINKFYSGTDKNDKSKAIIIDYTYDGKKHYGAIRILKGESVTSEYIPIYQLECDDLPDKHLNLGTFSNKDGLEYNYKIGKSLKTTDIKKLYKKYIKADEYVIVS